MSRQRTSMKKLREVYRLKFEFNYSNRLIAQSVNISAGSVSSYIKLFEVSGFNWLEVSHLDADTLEQKIYCHPDKSALSIRPLPDFDNLHAELKSKGVTRLLLWREYKDQHPNGVGYTRFCQLHQDYCKTLDPVMRFVHKAGEKTFVDYSGLKMEWIDPLYPPKNPTYFY